MVRKFLFPLLLLLLLTLSAVFIQLRIDQRPVPALSGYFYRAGAWNNYGLTVKLYQDKQLLGETLTSLNGYYEFPNLAKRNYQIYFFDRQYFINKKDFNYRGAAAKINHSFEDRFTHPFYFIETIGFLISIVVLILGLNILLRFKSREVAWSFFLLALTYVLLNSVEFLQIILGWLHREIIAANIFPLKHLGLAWFSPVFLYFWLVFPKRLKFAASPVWQTLLLLPYLETLVLCSWTVAGSDQVFQYIWGFTYAQFRILLIGQIFPFILGGFYFLHLNKKQEKDIALKNKLSLIEFGLGLFLAIVLVFVFIPVAFFQGHELFSVQYNFTVSLSGIILFSLIFYAITHYRVISFQQFASSSLTYSLLTFILTAAYSLLIVFLDKVFVRVNNYLLNAYILAFLIALFIPLKDQLQYFLDKLFLGDITEQRKALIELSRQLTGYLDQRKIIQLLQKNLKKFLNIKQVQVVLSDGPQQPEKTYLQPDHPDFPRIVGNQKQIELIIPIQSRRLIGYLLLGGKKSGLEYTELELNLLGAVASQAAIAMHNALLYQSLLSSQKEVERSARLASLGTLAAGLAHEIKNPLSAINNLVKIFPQRYQEPAFRDSFMNIVPRQLERINNLLRNLLDFAKPSALKFQRLNLSETVQKSLELLAVPARKAGVELNKNLQENIFYTGDEKALEQVFINLGLNAIEAMPEGGKLFITLQQEKNKIKAEIQDTGLGMDLKTQEKIFDPFFTTRPEGTGLGLAITRRILEQHRADIQVQSQKGKGTSFKINF